MQGRYSSSFFERLGVIFVLYQCTYDKYTLRLIVSVLVFRVTIMAVNDLSFFGRRAGRLYSSYFSSSADDIRANNMLVSLWLHNMTFFRFLLRIQLLFLAASVPYHFRFRFVHRYNQPLRWYEFLELMDESIDDVGCFSLHSMVDGLVLFGFIIGIIWLVDGVFLCLLCL